MSLSASSEEGITLSVTRGVLSTCTVCVRLRSGQKPPQEGLASSLGLALLALLALPAVWGPGGRGWP